MRHNFGVVDDLIRHDPLFFSDVIGKGVFGKNKG